MALVNHQPAGQVGYNSVDLSAHTLADSGEATIVNAATYAIPENEKRVGWAIQLASVANTVDGSPAAIDIAITHKGTKLPKMRLPLYGQAGQYFMTGVVHTGEIEVTAINCDATIYFEEIVK